MRLKSKYRAFRDGGRVDDLTVPVEPPVDPASAAPEGPPPVDNQPEPPAAPQPERQDDATLALRKQIEDLRKSEQARQAPVPMQDMTREQRLAAWKADGLSDAEVQLFQRNPAMIDHPQITGFAVQRAKDAGIKRGTDEHLAAVEQIFNASLAHLQAQESPQPMPQPTPEFFAPPPAPRPSRVGYSAPVSRSIPSGGSGRRESPGKVTLSPSEVEAARISGLSVEDYARQKIEYERQLSAGEYRDNREFK